MGADGRWTVVQHSGFNGGERPQFEKGLEPKRVTAPQARKVEAVGGLVFGSYGEADDFADKAMYPPGVDGLIPRAQGTFGSLHIDGLPIYLPVRTVVG